MDQAVLRALAKWPNVPNAYGWLALDRRGNWSIKGERIANPAVTAFIGRNYACDARGRWFFQNGPQRVFVSLAYTPYVVSTEPSPDGPRLRTHLGSEVEPASAWLDETGNLLLGVADSVAMIHDRDLAEALACLRHAAGPPLVDAEIEALLCGDATPDDVVLALGRAVLPLGRVQAAAVPHRFGFVPEPRPDPGEPEC
jgi:hypothetical protein